MAPPSTRILNGLFFLLATLSLAPIWAGEWFVTGDGPGHLYNARILHDLLLDHHAGFWNQFVGVNPYPDPNWFTTAAEAVLLLVFPAGLAEKILLSAYVAVFVTGFRFLVLQVHPQAHLWAFAALLLVWNQLVMKGFFNNVFSFAFAFWLVGFWWRWRNHLNTGKTGALVLASLPLYFAHPMGWVFAFLLMGSLTIGESLAQEKFVSGLRLLIRRGPALFWIMLPTAALLAFFFLRRPWSTATPESVAPDWDKLVKMTLFVIMDSGEKGLARSMGILLGGAFIAAVVLRIRKPEWLPTDGAGLFFGAGLALIAFAPASFTGGLEVPYRLGLFPVIGLAIWISHLRLTPIFQWVLLAGMILWIVAALAVRIPIHRQASDYVADMVALGQKTEPEKRLIAINYDWDGARPDGRPIANRNWLFLHADAYLGTDQALAIGGNYEANYGYFPLIARPETNAYLHMAREGIHFENRPPRADFFGYEKTTGMPVDYVLIWGQSPADTLHPFGQEIQQQLRAGFELLETSATGQARLYRRKGYSAD